MRYPIANVSYGYMLVRPLEDDEVDRREVEVWRHMQLTRTNRSRA